VLLGIALLWFSYCNLRNHSVAEAQQKTIAAALREPDNSQGRNKKLKLLDELGLLVQVDVPRDAMVHDKHKVLARSNRWKKQVCTVAIGIPVLVVIWRTVCQR
jgi:hypothetical protein